VTILEGESLINDGVALTAFGLAVEAMTHPFTFGYAAARLAEVAGGGVGYGLAVALVIGRVRRYVRDPSIQILVSLITPFVAYVPCAANWSARSGPSWTTGTGTGRSATRSAAPSRSRLTCRTARGATCRTPDRPAPVTGRAGRAARPGDRIRKSEH
jgi:NhaP-type Na+/H+ or K+/H+ antiporter